MNLDDITRVLLRDDLAVLESDDLEVLEILDSPWRRGEYDPCDVVLVSVGDGTPFVALEETDDIDWDGGALHRYVPIMAGPVQQMRAEQPDGWDDDDDAWGQQTCCGSACATCTGERGVL